MTKHWMRSTQPAVWKASFQPWKAPTPWPKRSIKRAPKLPKDHLMVVCLSGRGDKDMQTVMNHMAAQEKQA